MQARKMMKRSAITVLLLAVCCLVQQASAAEPTKLSLMGQVATAKLMDESKAATAEVVVRGTLEADAASLGRGGWPTYTMTVAQVYKTPKDVKIDVGQKLTVKTIKELTGMVTLYLVFDKDQNRYRLQDPYGERGFSHVGGRTSFALSLDKAKVGDLPKGWVAAKTGEGPGSVWKVMEDKNGKRVLAQTSNEGPNRFFNLCVAESTSFTDIDLTVAFKAKAGKLDQGGGPVWRYKDADNYYIARMNPLKDNYRVYKVVAGKRTQLGSADVKIPAGEWHTLRVVHKADHIQCYLDDKAYLDVKDDTFKDAGKIGLWTKADAQTYFANLNAEGL
jgi:hypothetical protein